MSEVKELEGQELLDKCNEILKRLGLSRGEIRYVSSIANDIKDALEARDLTDKYVCKHVAVALLHKAIEYPDVTYDSLEEDGIPLEARSAVDILTKKRDTSYTDYIRSIANTHCEVSIYVMWHILSHQMARSLGMPYDKYSLAHYIIESVVIEKEL